MGEGRIYSALAGREPICNIMNFTLIFLFFIDILKSQLSLFQQINLY